MREFSILIRPAVDIKGQWIAHCLNWDLVTQGDSAQHAVVMTIEAIAIAIEEDEAAGLDPADRPSAPREAWDLFSRTQHTGTRISPADVNTLKASPGIVIAAVMYMESAGKRGAPERIASIPGAPPPFMIAALQDACNSAHG